MLGRVSGRRVRGLVVGQWFGTAPAFLLILFFSRHDCRVVNSVRTVNEMRRSLDQNAGGTARGPNHEEKAWLRKNAEGGPVWIRCTSSRCLNCRITSCCGYRHIFTNSSLWMVLAVGLIGTFMLAVSQPVCAGAGPSQLMGEMAYKFIADMIQENRQ
ncbi:MAG: hypothetical protein CM15mP55_0210 [Hyphomicrobiales bacterium]|nr:MAG: hypothetical protein CM15mP55_0210 [Hyphomicrobiales bacterium]